MIGRAKKCLNRVKMDKRGQKGPKEVISGQKGSNEARVYQNKVNPPEVNDIMRASNSLENNFWVERDCELS